MIVLCPKCGAGVESQENSATCAACGASFAVGEAKTTADAAASPVDPLLGTVLGGCRLVERIGAGGMGVVYKAEQVSLGRIVAVKILPEALRRDPQIQERFQREIGILARLNHPNIVGILDGGISEQGAYFVMEYVDGVSLRRILSTGGMKPAEALKLIPQLCDALEYAHARGVVHRDIKPENILLDREGRMRLLDFGLSRIAKADEPGLLTRPTQVLGTFEYMAPEQREASRAVDHRADLYSLGVVLYEMLTGELPIGRFDPPSQRNIQIDVRLDEVVLRALEKSPDRRYQRASDIKTEMERISTSPPAAAAAPQVAPPPVIAAASPPPASASGPAAFAAGAAARASADSQGSAAAPPPGSRGFGGRASGFSTPLPLVPAEGEFRLKPAFIAVAFGIVAIVGLGSGEWLAAIVTAAILAYGLRQISPAPERRNQTIVWIFLTVMAIVTVGAENEFGSRFPFRNSFPFGSMAPWIVAVVAMGSYAWLVGRLPHAFASRHHAILWIALGVVGIVGIASGQLFGTIVAGGLLVFVERLVREHGDTGGGPGPSTRPQPAPPPVVPAGAPSRGEAPPASSASAFAAIPPPPAADGGRLAYAAPGLPAAAPAAPHVSKIAIAAFVLALLGVALLLIPVLLALFLPA